MSIGIFLTAIAIAIILYIYIRFSQNLKTKKALDKDQNTAIKSLHEDLKGNPDFRIAHEHIGADMKTAVAIDILAKQIAFISADKHSTELFAFNELLEVSKWEDENLIKRLAIPEYADAHLSGQEVFEIDPINVKESIHSLDLELTFSNGTIQKRRINFLPSNDPINNSEMTYHLNDIQRDSIKEKIDEWEILLSSIIKNEL